MMTCVGLGKIDLIMCGILMKVILALSSTASVVEKFLHLQFSKEKTMLGSMDCTKRHQVCRCQSTAGVEEKNVRSSNSWNQSFSVILP